MMDEDKGKKKMGGIMQFLTGGKAPSNPMWFGWIKEYNQYIEQRKKQFSEMKKSQRRNDEP